MNIRIRKLLWKLEDNPMKIVWTCVLGLFWLLFFVVWTAGGGG